MSIKNKIDKWVKIAYLEEFLNSIFTNKCIRKVNVFDCFLLYQWLQPTRQRQVYQLHIIQCGTII